MGTIQFDRVSGTEIWKIQISKFSITPKDEGYKVHIFVETEDEASQSLPDTGVYSTMIEVVFPLEHYPDFEEPLQFKMPAEEEIGPIWDEEGDHFCNWYYYEHRDIQDLFIQIEKQGNGLFLTTISGKVEDPIEAGSDKNTALKITFEGTLTDVFDGFWAV